MSKTVIFILAISIFSGVYHFIKSDALPDGDASVDAENLDETDSNLSDQEVVDGYAIERSKRDEEDKEENMARLNDLIDEIQAKRAKEKSDASGQPYGMNIKSKREEQEAAAPTSEALQLCNKVYFEDEKKLGECEVEVLYK